MDEPKVEARILGNPYIPTIYASHFAVTASEGVATFVFYDTRQIGGEVAAQEVGRIALPAAVARELARAVDQTAQALAVAVTPAQGSA